MQQVKKNANKYNPQPKKNLKNPVIRGDLHVNKTMCILAKSIIISEKYWYFFLPKIWVNITHENKCIHIYTVHPT